LRDKDTRDHAPSFFLASRQWVAQSSLLAAHPVKQNNRREKRERREKRREEKRREEKRREEKRQREKEREREREGRERREKREEKRKTRGGEKRRERKLLLNRKKGTLDFVQAAIIKAAKYPPRQHKTAPNQEPRLTTLIALDTRSKCGL